MKTKRLIVLILGLALVFCLTACGFGQQANNNSASDQEPEPDGAQTNDAEPSPVKDTDILVVVFSATGTTKGVADKIAGLTGADIRQIVPAQPYLTADLNYNDTNSRTSKEQNNANARPEIAEEISLDGYSTVYLGYPIWWGQAPRILSTFVENHDFTGITVIPFCTSGSSDIGQSDDTLAKQAGSGNWLQGKRFSGNTSVSELQNWINNVGGVSMEKSLHMSIGDTEVSVAWESNESVDTLINMVAVEPLVIKMSKYGGFEQVGPLGRNLPRNDEQTTTGPGDIVLYSGNQIVIFYGSNSWTYTRLGKITDKTAAEMTDLLGSDSITITISYN